MEIITTVLVYWHTFCITADAYLRFSHVTVSAMASQNTNVSIVCSAVFSGTNKTSEFRITSLGTGKHLSPVDSLHKGPVTRKMLPPDDVYMTYDIHARVSIHTVYNWRFITLCIYTQIARSMGTTRGSPGFCQSQMGPMLPPWTLLSGYISIHISTCYFKIDTTTLYMINEAYRLADIVGAIILVTITLLSSQCYSFEYRATRSLINSLWPNYAMWRYISGSKLIQVPAWCMTAPSHYLNQYWLIIKVFCGIPQRAISEEVLVNLIRNM